jgi:predicted RNA-binding protein
LFPQPVPVHDVLDDMSFIRSSKSWGLYFRGPVRTIPKSDYELIISVGSSN